MGVYIKGMRMPENCADCPVGWCNNLILFSESDKRADNCPLVEVPEPHGRLIDADATMKQWGLNNATKYGNKTAEQQHFSYSTMMMYEIADILDDAPVVIEAEGE